MIPSTDNLRRLAGRPADAAGVMSATGWSYTTGSRQHERAYDEGNPWRGVRSFVERRGRGYYWAVYLPLALLASGETATLPAAKRAADRAERDVRLTAALAALAVADAAARDARRLVATIKAERP